MNGFEYGWPDLFGQRPVQGYRRGAIVVRPVEKNWADDWVRREHYSKTVVWSSNIHLAAFLDNDNYDDGVPIGVLQFGPAMNPASGAKIVAGTEPDQWLELNRMVLDDFAKPEHAASQSIAAAVRLVRLWRPRLSWIQAFADERCGKLGAVYQAASFLYCGHHSTTFYELDGEFYHQSIKGRPPVDSRGWGCGPRISYFNENVERAVPHTFRQFRYIKPLAKWVRKNLRIEVLPYPKPNMEARTRSPNPR
jgi:hypothetical protein